MGIIALAATNIVALEVPLLAKEIVNQFDNLNPSDSLSKLAWAIVGLGLLQMIIRSLSRILIFLPGRLVETRVRSDLFLRLLRVSQSFFDRLGMGDVISRVANDTGDLRVFFAFGVLQLANCFFILVFTINQMYSLSPKLTMASLSPLILMFAIMRMGIPVLNRLSKRNQEALGRLSNGITETFVNVQTVKLLNGIEQLSKNMVKDHDLVYETNIKLLFVRVFLFPLMSLMIGTALVTNLWLGGHEILANRLTIGDLMAFNAYIGFLAFPLTSIGIIIAVFQRCRTALKRMSDIALEASETDRFSAQDESSPLASSKTDTLLEVRNLNFSYGPNSSFKLQNISFACKAGTSLGISGTVGSGKSTLLLSLCRLVNTPENTVFLEGADITNLHPDSLRREMLICLQTPHLFAMTIEENLRFGLGSFDSPGHTEISMEQLREAAHKAQILEEIESFPMAWKTQIGERGIRLSGGQKQRLALARAFLRKPKILLLDDVLAAVDQSTERALAKVISETKATLIVASHRPSVLERCDQRLQMFEGQIV